MGVHVIDQLDELIFPNNTKKGNKKQQQEQNYQNCQGALCPL